MTVDRTLKQHGGLARNRNVLTRAEKIANLTDEGKFDPEKDSPLGLPKVKVKHSKIGTKQKKAAEEKTEEASAGAEEATPVAAEDEAKGKKK